jgi:energy-coupling factor transporter ATP-binding protein EcfA2
MTVGENLMLPLRLFASLSERAMVQIAEFKLALVGLQACFHQAPATLGGGMIKRVAIARSLMLNPELLCLDEPDSGLDPVNVAWLDALILSLRQDLGTAVILVTHSVASVFAVADRALFFDERLHTMTALIPQPNCWAPAGARVLKASPRPMNSPVRAVCGDGAGAAGGGHRCCAGWSAVHQPSADPDAFCGLGVWVAGRLAGVLREVAIGNVSQIGLALNGQSGQIEIPVTARLNADLVRQLVSNTSLTPTATSPSAGQTLLGLIDQGLSARLATQSLLTGQRYVDLDVRPELIRTPSPSAPAGVPEVPTLPTTLQALQAQLEGVD